MTNNVTIVLDNVGKRFNREWIFRHCSYRFEWGKSYAITGSNGSGKSTLLQVISGSLTHNEGTITVTANGQPVADDQLYNHVAIAAPYLELVEEMTAVEMLHFHAQFKTLIPGLTIDEMLKTVSLEKAAHKQIRYYSSGMKQRLKLAQAFFSDTAILLLDEPTTNLDADGVALYHQLINNRIHNRLVIVSSNDKQEYDFCEAVVAIGDYK
ncbi:MAG: ABC transporter ATP-binding protein [Bacteroidetes bacterium]|nr:ABC transporter ATP-binding protein [Bacteroidota bacterium]